MHAGFASSSRRIPKTNTVRKITDGDSKSKQNSQHLQKGLALSVPCETRSNTKPGEPKATKIEDKSKKNEKVTKQLHLGKHSNFNVFSDGNKNSKIPALE